MVLEELGFAKIFAVVGLFGGKTGGFCSFERGGLALRGWHGLRNRVAIKRFTGMAGRVQYEVFSIGSWQDVAGTGRTVAAAGHRVP